ncbi:sulfate adenylate transferase [Siphonobacter sp. BAB-5405]|uniref:phosphoadenosine phosphosulfate reductase domain-containing protein n=1 Tax=Siphonobacter sp. BAB-5405 TaxID=1864825 RepID=UPI000C80D686|nr:phosphoadenosine phosphosulfate reductase family protein [Siphonobacter sp. BAB-5405]PMD95537.1 sulfate adenylate transferase [Siphonobacter sp. BAB-5405]
MKILVAFSGGKDSQASLIWAVDKFGIKNVSAVFCDTGWEHQWTYNHVVSICKKMGVPLVELSSKKYKGMVGLATSKKRFPSTKARFCTEELKTKPMIDYVLDEVKDHCMIIQGIRADESKNRSLMAQQCTYFKYYFQPYDDNQRKLERLEVKKNLSPKEVAKKVILLKRIAMGKLDPVYFSYRKRDVIAFCKTFADEVFRPVFDWTGQQVMQYILENGQKPNPLYYQGYSRVGCFPCVMCTHSELRIMLENDPEYIDRVRDAEQFVGRTFFPPNYVPNRYASKTDVKSGKRINSIDDVVRYISDKNATGELFPEEKDTDRRCMSFYGICE